MSACRGVASIDGPFQGELEMNTVRVSIGSLELSVSGGETVNVPVWVGVIALLAGGFLLVAPRAS